MVLLTEWRNLYDHTQKIREIEPWQFMEEPDIVGVQNPITNEIGYCCVMGGLGELLGIAVYLGAEGLEGYLKMASGEITGENPDDMMVQKCLMVTFENRDSLEKEDLAVIKKLGLKFRGSNNWPLFRSYLPGYYPWFLTKEEVIFLSLILEQFILVADRFERDERTLTAPKQNQYLVRTSESTPSGLKWRDQWIEPAPYRKAVVPIPQINELLLHKIKKGSSEIHASWEIELCHAPFPVAEGGRPFYPYFSMILDTDSKYILGSNVFSLTKYETDFQEQLLKTIEDNGAFPKEIHVGREEVYRLIAPIADALDIKIKLLKKLPGISAALRELSKFK